MGVLGLDARKIMMSFKVKGKELTAFTIPGGTYSPILPIIHYPAIMKQVAMATVLCCTLLHSHQLLQRVTVLGSELDIEQIQGFVTCVYQNQWWVACTIQLDEENIKVSFLHPHGPSRSFRNPSTPESPHDPCWRRIDQG